MFSKCFDMACNTAPVCASSVRNASALSNTCAITLRRSCGRLSVPSMS
jgi:hypothetical protein